MHFIPLMQCVSEEIIMHCVKSESAPCIKSQKESTLNHLNESFYNESLSLKTNITMIICKLADTESALCLSLVIVFICACMF